MTSSRPAAHRSVAQRRQGAPDSAARLPRIQSICPANRESRRNLRRSPLPVSRAQAVPRPTPQPQGLSFSVAPTDLRSHQVKYYATLCTTPDVTWVLQSPFLVSSGTEHSTPYPTRMPTRPTMGLPATLQCLVRDQSQCGVCRPGCGDACGDTGSPAQNGVRFRESATTSRGRRRTSRRDSMPSRGVSRSYGTR